MFHHVLHVRVGLTATEQVDRGQGDQHQQGNGGEKIEFFADGQLHVARER